MMLSELGMSRLDDCLDHFDDLYQGEYDSLRAFAEQYWDDVGYQQVLDTLPPEVLMFVTVNYDEFGEMMTADQYVARDETTGKVHIFRDEY